MILNSLFFFNMVIPQFAFVTGNKLLHINLILKNSINRLLHFHNRSSESAMNQPMIDYNRSSAHHYTKPLYFANIFLNVNDISHYLLSILRHCDIFRNYFIIIAL